MNKNFKVLVVDDEVLIAEFLKDILISLDIEAIFLAHDKPQAVQQIEEHNPNLILLDIRMKSNLEGIRIAELINLKYKIPFIFITAHSDKEIVEKALGTNPMGYITKPFKKMDVYAAIKIFLQEEKEVENNFILIKDGYHSVKLEFDKILYAESDGNYIHIYTKEKKFTIRFSLEWFLKKMPSANFSRIHRSYVVNTHKITKYSSKGVWIEGKEIPVSRKN